jgi:OCT family organic cation transporter-like MFS transporter 4/5
MSGMEFVGPKYRMFCGIVIEIFFAAGEVLLGLIAYFIREWNILHLVLHSVGIVFLLYYW